MIPIDKIRPNPFQPRETFDKEKIKELADSIRGSGLVEPIIVRRKGNTYQIIAGERRWRAYQFADLKKVPSIVREADDIETRELSFIENWHRLRVDSVRVEDFIASLYEDGVKKGRYRSVKDMAKKTGIPRQTLQEIILSHGEKKELGATGGTLTYTDLRETRALKDQPRLRKTILKLREKGILARDELRNYSTVVREASPPVRKALLKEDSKLTSEEAGIIDAELTTPEEKEKVISELERERSPDRVKSHIEFARWIGKAKEREAKMVERVTRDVWTCPICSKKFDLIHVEPGGTHRFRERVE